VQPHVQGDVDCNDIVNLADLLAVLLQAGSAGAAPACAGHADVNCDGAVDGFDALLILFYVSHLTSTIPGCAPVGAMA
jgi:hypothetical protein